MNAPRPLLKFAEHGRGWWFDGDRFYRNRSDAEAVRGMIAPGSPEASNLLEVICRRLFQLNRWQGEAGRLGCVSIGAHSLLVAGLAARIGEARGAIDRQLCYRAGVAHDLGEALGTGDPAGPLVRAYPGIRELAERHQRAAERLLGFGFHGKGVRTVVRDADHLAAAIERRVFFADDSREMEAPGMDELAAECGIEFSESHLWALLSTDADKLITAISPPT